MVPPDLEHGSRAEKSLMDPVICLETLESNGHSDEALTSDADMAAGIEIEQQVKY
jgi:hypothetical protein